MTDQAGKKIKTNDDTTPRNLIPLTPAAEAALDAEAREELEIEAAMAAEDADEELQALFAKDDEEDDALLAALDAEAIAKGRVKSAGNA